jgi:hypothetical protein
MKTLKTIQISLAIAAVALIGFFAWKFTGETLSEPDKLQKSANPWVKDIKAEIDSLVPKQANLVNARKSYANIQAHIDDNYKNKRLCEIAGDEASNETNRRLLSERLYASYFKKFVELSYKVFNGSEWQPKDLQSIGEEIDRLKKSPHFDGKDYQGKEIDAFNAVLSKYREIAGFISACSGFSYSCYELTDNCRFPDVSDKIQKSRSYLANSLDDPYVNNCTRLKDGLRAVPQTLLDKHIAYLRAKIRQNGNKYTDSQYNKYQSDYSNNVYAPLSSQIAQISGDTYGVNVEAAKNNLIDLLDEYNDRATEYYIDNRK